MNIIFLDILGVLCTKRSQFSIEYGIISKEKEYFIRKWDETGVGLIKNICHEFDSKIVITSRLRYTDKNYYLKIYLNMN